MCSSTVPVKDPFSATVKSTNYLLNALALQNAQRNGFDQASSFHALELAALLLAHRSCMHEQARFSQQWSRMLPEKLTGVLLRLAGHLCDGGWLCAGGSQHEPGHRHPGQRVHRAPSFSYLPVCGTLLPCCPACLSPTAWPAQRKSCCALSSADALLWPASEPASPCTCSLWQRR